MTKFFLGATLALSLLSCNNSKSEELQLKKKELELKEKELNLEISKLKKVDSVSSSDVKKITEKAVIAEQQSQKAKDPSVSDINNVLGYWVDNENDNIAMYLERDGTFAFRDFNTSTLNYEELTGTYKLNDGKLTLMYNDRAQQTFRFVKEISTVPIYYIQKDRYLMVKAIVKE